MFRNHLRLKLFPWYLLSMFRTTVSNVQKGAKTLISAIFPINPGSKSWKFFRLPIALGLQNGLSLTTGKRKDFQLSRPPQRSTHMYNTASYKMSFLIKRMKSQQAELAKSWNEHWILLLSSKIRKYKSSFCVSIERCDLIKVYATIT